MTNIPHFNVIFATPGNSFTPGYMRSILKTIYFLNKENISWNFLNSGGSLVSLAREQTIAGWNFNSLSVQKPCDGEFTYDKIFWIDSDIEWEVIDFFRLYNSDKDIISGCYLMENRHTPIYTEVKGMMMSEKFLLDKKEIFKAVGVGFGFLAVKNGVFEKMPRPWFGAVNILNKNSEISLIGEDLSWCTKAIKSGFDIWVDPNVKVSHQKTFKINWE